MQLDSAVLRKEQKKLKKYFKEQDMLEKILVHIKQCQTYNELCSNPISNMYGFEALKQNLSGYYSFNLCKNGGVIRLICSIDKDNNLVKIEFISMDHYRDFKK